MEELGENLLLAPNDHVCLLFDQHDALKVKEEMETPRILVRAFDDSASSASNSPHSTPSPQRDLSPPSSSESCEEYLHFSSSNPLAPTIVVADDDDEDDFHEDNRNLLKDDNNNFQFNDMQEDKQRKRKRVNKVTFVGETNILWQDYFPSENSVLLFQDNKMLNENFGMSVTHMDKTICPASDISNTYILYKQNQFKLCCKLSGVLQSYSTVDPTKNIGTMNVAISSELLPLEGLYFHIYAIKHAGDKIDNITPVPLHQAGPSRTKKEMKPVQPTHITNGSSLFAKLQFQSSTPAGKEFFFRIIACLVAKTPRGSHMIMAKISPKLIVRAQNPGRYSVMGQEAHNTTHYPQHNPQSLSPNFTIHAPHLSISPPPVHTIPFLPPPPTSQLNNSSSHIPQALKRDHDITSSAKHNLNTTPIHLHTSSLPVQLDATPMIPVSQPPCHPSSLPPPMQSYVNQFEQNHQPFLAHTQVHHHPQTYHPQYSTQPYSPSPSYHPHAPLYGAPPVQYPPSEHVCAPSAWQTGPHDVSYHFGRVGINTSIPPEALTVQGNILVTGDLLKPSDRRLKRNLRSVSSAAQLASIEGIKIYDYEVRTDDKGNYKNERGFIAQELKDVVPQAVETIAPLHTDLGESMYIVNDRVLLIESLGATKQLDKIVKQEQAALQYVNKKVKELEDQENRNASALSRTVQSMVDIIMSEDFRETAENECLYCGTSIMGLGPAWTIFMIGFFFSPAWILGTLYLGSKLHAKKVAGLANFLMLCSVILILVSFAFYTNDVFPRLAAAVVILMVVGIVLVYIISYFRDRRHRLEQSVWKRLRKLGSEQAGVQQAHATDMQNNAQPQSHSQSNSPTPTPTPIYTQPHSLNQSQAHHIHFQPQSQTVQHRAPLTSCSSMPTSSLCPLPPVVLAAV